MAKGPVNRQEAESTVFDNLGLGPEELGLGDEGADDEIDSGDGNDEGNDDGSEGDETHRSQERDDDLDPPVRRQQQQPRRKQNDQRREQDDLTRGVLDDLSGNVTHTQQFAKGAPVKPDNKGNLVDQKTGQIVARAGSEARLYTAAHKARGEVAKVTRERDDVQSRLERAIKIGQDLNGENERLKAANAEVDKLGLNATERLEALQMAVEAKTNPIPFLKKILTRAAANGIDMTSLGIQPGGLDAKAFLDMIKSTMAEGMKPLQQRSETEAKTQEQQQQAAQAFERTKADTIKFFEDNPEAQAFIPVFEKIYDQPQFKRMPLSEIWLRIQLHQAQNGQSRLRRTNGQRRPGPGLPNGRPAMFDGSDRSGQSEMASPDESYDSIIRDTLRRAGG